MFMSFYESGERMENVSNKRIINNLEARHINLVTNGCECCKLILVFAIIPSPVEMERLPAATQTFAM